MKILGCQNGQNQNSFSCRIAIANNITVLYERLSAISCVVIDFNRNEYGDPWEEFNRIVWCAQSTPLFATGMVDGYFGGEVPMEFWELLALYICSNTLSSLPWAIPFGEEEIEVMKKLAKDVLEWYDGMTSTVPKWYVRT